MGVVIVEYASITITTYCFVKWSGKICVNMFKRLCWSRSRLWFEDGVFSFSSRTARAGAFRDIRCVQGDASEGGSQVDLETFDGVPVKVAHMFMGCFDQNSLDCVECTERFLQVKVEPVHISKSVHWETFVLHQKEDTLVLLSEIEAFVVEFDQQNKPSTDARNVQDVLEPDEVEFAWGDLHITFDGSFTKDNQFGLPITKYDWFVWIWVVGVVPKIRTKGGHVVGGARVQ